MGMLDIIILLVVVFFIFKKLKDVLGTTPESEEQTKLAQETSAKIFNLIIKEAEKAVAEQQESATENLSEIDEKLIKIPNFNKNLFLDGAKKAFELVLKSFCSSDVQTLEMLVNKDLYKKILLVLEQRKDKGLVCESDFIGFNSVEIKDAKISKNGVAKIVVEFVSEQMNLLKNSNGDIVEGDDKFIQKITDLWTFEKNVNSANPNWILVSTKK